MDMESDEKPIINLTIFIKVRHHLSITPFWNGVPSAHNKILSHAPYVKEPNLLDIPPRSNRSALICLPNRLSNSTLNSMNLFKASDFLWTRYTYPNLEYPSIKNEVPIPFLCMNSKSFTLVNMY